MFFAPIQVTSNVLRFYHLLSLLPNAVLLIPSRVRVYIAFGVVYFFCCFCFFVENKYFWGHLGGSIGVWAQLIFYGFQTWVSLVSLSPGFGGWGRKSQAPIG